MPYSKYIKSIGKLSHFFTSFRFCFIFARFAVKNRILLFHCSEKLFHWGRVGWVSSVEFSPSVQRVQTVQP